MIEVQAGFAGAKGAFAMIFNDVDEKVQDEVTNNLLEGVLKAYKKGYITVTDVKTESKNGKEQSCSAKLAVNDKLSDSELQALFPKGLSTTALKMSYFLMKKYLSGEVKYDLKETAEGYQIQLQ